MQGLPASQAYASRIIISSYTTYSAVHGDH